jgi:hypothetical protein
MKSFKNILQETKNKFTDRELEEMTQTARGTLEHYVAKAFENYDEEINKEKPNGKKLRQYRQQIQEYSTLKSEIH